jgi:hypothetical protein
MNSMQQNLAFSILSIALIAGSSAAHSQSVVPTQPIPGTPSSHGTNCSPGTNNEFGKNPSESLSDRLANSNGVICPPSDVDSNVVTPPQGQQTMPVIPPPGTPGGDQSVQPK